MKYKAILLLLGVAIIASGILSFMPIEKACGLEENGCYKVAVSDYESTFGIKNSHLGLTAFTTLFLITLSHFKKPTKRKKQIITLGLSIGSALGIYFLYLQFFVINATCPYCLATDAGIILSLIIFIFAKDKKQIKQLKP